MRTALLIGGLLVGFAVAAVVGSIVGFFGLFYLLRLACWLAGSDDFMPMMWFAIFVVPLAGVLFPVAGWTLVLMLWERRVE